MEPAISRRRMSVWPISLTEPSHVLPPVDLCRGTRPSHAAKFRPLLNVSRSGANADPFGPMMPNSARFPRGPLISCVRCRTRHRCVRNATARPWVSALFIATKRMVGRKAAFAMASASARSFFCRFTNGFTRPPEQAEPRGCAVAPSGPNGATWPKPPSQRCKLAARQEAPQAASATTFCFMETSSPLARRHRPGSYRSRKIDRQSADLRRHRCALRSVPMEPSWHMRCRWWGHPPHQFTPLKLRCGLTRLCGAAQIGLALKRPCLNVRCIGPLAALRKRRICRGICAPRMSIIRPSFDKAIGARDPIGELFSIIRVS
ncbi:hypothetical protein SAMN05877809_1132 [Rhodobacter sp. JA431]|nr:hypothetical protein SAMN05877809_1132 [Rhodobacter sp. JA431]